MVLREAQDGKDEGYFSGAVPGVALGSSGEGLIWPSAFSGRWSGPRLALGRRWRVVAARAGGLDTMALGVGRPWIDGSSYGLRFCCHEDTSFLLCWSDAG